MCHNLPHPLDILCTNPSVITFAANLTLNEKHLLPAIDCLISGRDQRPRMIISAKTGS